MNVITRIKRNETGTCGFIGYTAQAREYWNSQAFATSTTSTTSVTSATSAPANVTYKFGKCPGCNTGLNTESDYVMIVCSGDETEEGSTEINIRCISCYEVMFMTSK